jgi:hypothetical protein
MTLADDQASLVAALVAGGPLPDGFATERVRVAREALLRKRSGEVAAAWPVLAANLGPQWTVEFREWARDRTPNGSYRDGLEFARYLDEAGRLPEAARDELRATSAGRWWRSTTRRWSARLRRAR